MPSPGGCAAPKCRISATPTAGSCICAAIRAGALDYLEPAAEALPDTALVQVHRGEAEFALARYEAAGQSFTRALAAHEAGSPLPAAAAAARARLAEIEALLAAPAGGGSGPGGGGGPAPGSEG